MKKNKFYVVWNGRVPGIYYNWPSASKQVHRFPNGHYKSFITYEEAKSAFANRKPFKGGSYSHAKMKPVYKRPAEPSVYYENSICVDGAWSPSTLDIEYRAVLLPTKQELFCCG